MVCELQSNRNQPRQEACLYRNKTPTVREFCWVGACYGNESEDKQARADRHRKGQALRSSRREGAIRRGGGRRPFAVSRRQTPRKDRSARGSRRQRRSKAQA